MNKRYLYASLLPVSAILFSDINAKEAPVKNSAVKSTNFEIFKNIKNKNKPNYRSNADAYKNLFRSSKIAKNIIIEGLDRISKDVVSDYIFIGKDKNLSIEEQIDITIKTLRNSGLFSKVNVYRSNNQYRIVLEENPLIEQVAFEGNENVNDDMLKKTVSANIAPGRTFNKSSIQESVSNMQMAYKATGFPSATIVPKVINLPGHKVNVIFEIKEGKKTTVERIIFCGNKAFSGSFLKDKIITKESATWKFWNNSSAIFSEDKVYADIEALRSFYRNSGYPDIEVNRIASEMSYDKEKSYITVIIHEGDLYKFNKPVIESEISGINAKRFNKYIKISNGDVYSAAAIEQNRQSILKHLTKDGRTFVNVMASTKFDKNSHKANVIYKIVETKRFFVEKIDILGNNVTADYVLRDRFRFHEGDPLNPWLLELAKQELEETDFFESVDVLTQPGTLPDRLKIIIKVKEKEATNSVNLACTVSDTDGLGGMLGYTNSNFRGRGQVFSADIIVAQKSLNGSLSLTEPNFIWKDVTGTIEIGGDFRNRKKEEHARYRSIYVSPSIGYKINDNLYHTLSTVFTFGEKLYIDHKGKRLKEVTGNEPEVSTVAIDEFGRYKCGEISSVLTYSKNDGKFNSKRGYSISLRNSYAGFLGDVKFFKNSLAAEYYMPLNILDDKTMFVIKGQIGHIHEIKNVRSAFRYQFGGDGNLFRGFDACGVSPREHNDDSIGGTNFWAITLAIKHPLSGSDLGLFGSAFIDIGSVWGVPWKYNQKNPNRVQKDIYGYNDRYLRNPEFLNIQDSNKARISIGVAIEWRNCPLGAPMTFSFAVPLRKASIDKRRTFTLSGMMF